MLFFVDGGGVGVVVGGGVADVGVAVNVISPSVVVIVAVDGC